MGKSRSICRRMRWTFDAGAVDADVATASWVDYCVCVHDVSMPVSMAHSISAPRACVHPKNLWKRLSGFRNKWNIDESDVTNLKAIEYIINFIQQRQLCATFHCCCCYFGLHLFIHSLIWLLSLPRVCAWLCEREYETDGVVLREHE